jgi:internalin A
VVENEFRCLEVAQDIGIRSSPSDVGSGLLHDRSMVADIARDEKAVLFSEASKKLGDKPRVRRAGGAAGFLCLIALTLSLTTVSAWGQDASPDRIVAEWMVRMGGSVVIEGQHKPISDIADLPTSDFTVHTLNFTGITQWASALEDELRRLPPLKHVKEVYVNGRLWYDQPVSLVQATLMLFSGSPELETFVLSRPVQTYIPFDDTVVKAIQPLPQLKELRIRQTRVGGAALASFSLKRLDLNYDRTFNDVGLGSLKSMTGLTTLYLRGTSVTDAGIKNLSGLTNLTDLDLADVGISDAGLAELAGLTKLRRLNLQASNVTDAGLDTLAGVTGLEELSLYRTRVTNAGLAKLTNLKELRAVDLRYSRATASGVHELVASLPKLDVMFQDSSLGEVKRTSSAESAASKGEPAIAGWLRSIGGTVEMHDGHVTGVSMKSTSITDREIEIFTKLPHLTELSLRNTEISDVGLAHFSSVVPLKKLDLSYTLLSDSALARLKPLVNLETLSLNSTQVEGPGLAAIEGLTKLRELNIENTPLKNEAMQHIGKLTGLEHLSIGYTDVTDKGMPGLANLKNLKRLNLAGDDIRDAGLKNLAAMDQMEDLDLSFCRFTESGLKILNGLTNLKRLGLNQTSANDEGMEWVGKLAKLQSLSLEFTAVDDAGFAKLANLSSMMELHLDHVALTDASVKLLTGMSKLSYLDLYHTGFSEQGYENLKKALPGCNINWNKDSTKRERRT